MCTPCVRAWIRFDLLVAGGSGLDLDQIATSGTREFMKRQVTRHDCLLTLLAMGTNEVKQCAVRKNIFCNGPTRAAEAGKNLLYTNTMSSTNQSRKDPFMYYLSPYLPYFQVSTVSSLLEQWTQLYSWPWKIIGARGLM